MSVGRRSLVRLWDIPSGELLAEDEQRISVADIVRLLGPDRKNADLLRRASELPALPEPVREHFRSQLAKA